MSIGARGWQKEVKEEEGEEDQRREKPDTFALGLNIHT